MANKSQPASKPKHAAPPAPDRVIAEAMAVYSSEISVSATVAQNEFGRMLNNAVQGRVVVINRHNAPSAVLISSDRYRELTQGASNRLDLLTQQFDSLVARMQSPSVRDKMQSAFDATPEALARAVATSKRSSKRK